jgi:hypothetical protein
MKNYFNISAPPPPFPNILQPFCTDNRGITNTSNKGQNMNTLQVIIQEQSDAEPWTRIDGQPFKQSHIHQSYPSANEET